MNFKWFDVYGGGLAIFSILSAALVLFFVGCAQSFFVSGPSLYYGGVFICDSVSYYLSILSILLGLSLVFMLDCLSGVGRFMIVVSLAFSIVSYSCVHGVWFWVAYEMSILPLLFLLISESPYSERYVASWYLLGYVVLTSLPMLLCIFYVSLELGSFNIGCWEWGEGLSIGVVLLLGVMFITKIPLPPFHVWLPIVHAEASSSVSVCLSGYIMKLGILGVCRFCFWIIPSYVFSPAYLLVGMSAAVLFFFCASRELDGKRWLAFLSLSHIIISSVCLSLSGFDLSGVSFVYCLGHGISAGVIFIFLWGMYEVFGSRNWSILKYGLSSSLGARVLCGGCLCTAASLPPTLQFFSEVFVVEASGVLYGASFLLALFLYLFMGGLVPVFLLGSLLTRHYSLGWGLSNIWGYMGSMLFLLVWGFGFFLLS